MDRYISSNASGRTHLQRSRDAGKKRSPGQSGSFLTLLLGAVQPWGVSGANCLDILEVIGTMRNLEEGS